MAAEFDLSELNLNFFPQPFHLFSCLLFNASLPSLPVQANPMNQNGCDPSRFTDQVIQHGSSCTELFAVWVATSAVLSVSTCAGFVLVLTNWCWARRVARLNFPANSRKRREYAACCGHRLPLLVIFVCAFYLLSILYILLSSLGAISFDSGTSYVVITLLWTPMFGYIAIGTSQYLKLGMKSIPLASRMQAANQEQSVDSIATTTRDGSPVRELKMTTANKQGVSTLVFTMYYVFVASGVVKLIYGLILPPLLPGNSLIVTIAYVINLAADVSAFCIVLQLQSNISALRSLTTPRAQRSRLKQTLLGIRVVQMVAIIHIGFGVTIDCVIIAGIRHWWVIHLQIALTNMFIILYSLATVQRRWKLQRLNRQLALMKKKQQLQKKQEEELGDQQQRGDSLPSNPEKMSQAEFVAVENMTKTSSSMSTTKTPAHPVPIFTPPLAYQVVIESEQETSLSNKQQPQVIEFNNFLELTKLKS